MLNINKKWHASSYIYANRAAKHKLRRKTMRTWLLLGIFGLALLAAACSPHREWYHGGYCEYWNGQTYDSYPA